MTARPVLDDLGRLDRCPVPFSRRRCAPGPSRSPSCGMPACPGRVCGTRLCTCRRGRYGRPTGRHAGRTGRGLRERAPGRLRSPTARPPGCSASRCLGGSRSPRCLDVMRDSRRSPIRRRGCAGTAGWSPGRCSRCPAFGSSHLSTPGATSGELVRRGLTVSRTSSWPATTSWSRALGPEDPDDPRVARCTLRASAARRASTRRWRSFGPGSGPRWRPGRG